MNSLFSGGMWPVMITPFTNSGGVDYDSLLRLIEWYEDRGADGLFAVCQSSEMFYLSRAERVSIAKFVKEHARIPVVASGHISDNLKDQLMELGAIAESGIDALILVTNRLASEDENDDTLLKRLDTLMAELPREMPLGFYECPNPYKRLLNPKIIQYMIECERFFFIKDTSCSTLEITKRVKQITGSRIKLYNANTATLLDSLKAGCAGYSGVMANFHPKLYRWLLDHWQDEPQKALEIQEILTMCSLIESHNYPRNAKYMLQLKGLGMTQYTRKPGSDMLTEAERIEVEQLLRLSARMEASLQN